MTGKRPRVSAARLDELIAEATVECYNEEEQLTGLFTLIEDNLALPRDERAGRAGQRSRASI